MLINHQTGRSLLCDWTLHQITEDWATNIEDASIGPNSQWCHPPYCPSSNNQHDNI